MNGFSYALTSTQFVGVHSRNVDYDVMWPPNIHPIDDINNIYIYPRNSSFYDTAKNKYILIHT